MPVTRVQCRPSQASLTRGPLSFSGSARRCSTGTDASESPGRARAVSPWSLSLVNSGLRLSVGAAAVCVPNCQCQRWHTGIMSSHDRLAYGLNFSSHEVCRTRAGVRARRARGPGRRVPARARRSSVRRDMELAAAALIWEQHIRAAAFISREHDSKEFFFHDALERLGGANSAGKELPPLRRFCTFMVASIVRSNA